MEMNMETNIVEKEPNIFDVVERLLKRAKKYKPDHELPLSDAKNGESFLWDILSSLRGYDGFGNLSAKEYYRLKDLTTGRIRAILGFDDAFHPLALNTKPLTKEEIAERNELLQKIRGGAKGSHFETHFLRALQSLKKLKYDVPWEEILENPFGAETS